MSTATEILHRLTLRYLISLWLLGIVLFIGIGLICFFISSFFFSTLPASVFSVLLATGSIVSYLMYYKAIHIDVRRVAYFLNHRYPELQESVDLILVADDALSPLTQIQKHKVEQVLEKTKAQIRLPLQWKVPVSLFSIGVLLTVFVPQPDQNQRLTEQHYITEADQSLAESYAAIKNSSITILPPTYTGLKKISQASTEIKAVAGSDIRWELVFNEPVNHVRFIFSGTDTADARGRNNTFIFDTKLSASSFYQIQWQSSDSIITTGFFPIQMIADEPPVIDVSGLSQFTSIGLKEKQTVDVKATVTDDFGLTDAFINATVSKGSGESVKFREEKIRFSTPLAMSGKRITPQHVLSLQQLGLEPGDELYFYIEAFDNKQPDANRTRTETFFIALEDTTQAESVADEGLGVDLMPEYFRSQRQIIIDSEKLLAAQKKISREEFSFKSNELGYDQKVLRLRYGQFLGEEFETNIGPGGHIEEEEHHHEEGEHDEDKDVTKSFGHQHDTENEHNLVPASPQAHDHAHNHETTKEGKEENPFEEFVHQHDNAEEATFFIQSVRAKLKAALTLMWDAELQLRLSEPARSLPYQYKILKLLKEISNDSRIYVHRTGFDPPPLKEEKRLTADLSEIKPATHNNPYETSLTFTAVQQAIQILHAISGEPLSVFEKSIFANAGSEVAPLAIEQPGVHLKTLSNLKTLSEITTTVPAELVQETLQQLWRLLPEEPQNPSKVKQSPAYWGEEFFHQLEKVK